MDICVTRDTIAALSPTPPAIPIQVLGQLKLIFSYQFQATNNHSNSTDARVHEYNFALVHD